jgi:hypothetical protein
MRLSKLGGIVLSIACATTFSLLSAPAFGAAIINVDENGHGTLNGAAVPSIVFMEPMSGQLALVYSFLQFPFNNGDVLIKEADGSNSDLLRFSGPPSTLGSLYVFSDIEPGDHDLADLGLPTPLTPLVTLTETTFGNGVDGVVYTPGPNQPGFFTGGVTYTFLSDVPEPATYMLLTAPLLVFALLRRRPLTYRQRE